MSERITVSQAAALLKEADRVLILTHQSPDGDTLGSGAALCRALRALGKRAQVVCSDPIPERFAYLFEGLPEDTFEPAFLCAVDVADAALLGKNLEQYAERIHLCIDHHALHREFADKLLLDDKAGANAMNILRVVTELGVPIDTEMADDLYTGIATDTGCFKYSNTTAVTHRMAAQLMEAGAHAENINRAMFDLKSRARLALEREALASVKYYCHDRVAVMTVTEQMLKESGATEDDMEGLAPLPRQIEGVWIGFFLRQRGENTYKISARTGTHADAAAVCAMLGGGGHARAAGCTLTGTQNECIERLLKAAIDAVPRLAEE